MMSGFSSILPSMPDLYMNVGKFDFVQSEVVLFEARELE